MTLRLGRYVVCDEIAAGGMATVHVGRLVGPAGFSRTVAIKRLHPQFAKDPEFVAMLLDEARLAARVRHPNVVTTLDVVASKGELFLIMEYVAGESFSALIRASKKAGRRVEPALVSAVVSQTLLGLHAAHEATDERGRPLHLVHRDVSPQNVLVGTDGVARVVDFGVAKAASRTQTTTDGQIKGKLAYMAPEQLLRSPVDRRADVFAAGVVLWEALTGARLFASDDIAASVAHILECKVEPVSRLAQVPREVDEVLSRALAPRAADRFPTAREMAIALGEALPPATTMEVGEWVESFGGDALARKAKRVAEMESSWPEAIDDEGAGVVQVLVADSKLREHADADTEVDAPIPKPSSRLTGLPLRAGAVTLLVVGAGLIGYRLRSDRPVPTPPPSAPLSSPIAAETPPAPLVFDAGVAPEEIPSPKTAGPAVPVRKRSAAATVTHAPAPKTSANATRPGLAPLKEYE